MQNVSESLDENGSPFTDTIAAKTMQDVRESLDENGSPFTSSIAAKTDVGNSPDFDNVDSQQSLLTTVTETMQNVSESLDENGSSFTATIAAKTMQDVRKSLDENGSPFTSSIAAKTDFGNSPDFDNVDSQQSLLTTVTETSATSCSRCSHIYLPVASRLILYGLCGFFAEVMFTATWYFCDQSRYTHGWKLHGCTSVWSFPIYSLSSYVVEKLFLALNGKVSLFVRGFIYLGWTYLWEYITGFVLRQFNACPWDYTEYTYFNIHGLITFDYAPLWYIGSMLLEIVIIQSALQLQYRIEHQKIE